MIIRRKEGNGKDTVILTRKMQSVEWAVDLGKRGVSHSQSTPY